MATLETLLANVKDSLLDSSISDDFIVAKINQGLEVCAANVLLPLLESKGVFTTDPETTSVDTPTLWNYHRGLYGAHVQDEDNIAVVSSVGLLQLDHPEFDDSTITNGSIETLTLRAGQIIYFPSPDEASEVSCRFYQKPTLLTSDSSSPDCLPIGLHEELLESYALWKCWEKLEDGIEGIKINTAHCRNAFNVALAELDDLIDEGQSTARPKKVNWWV